MRIRSILILCVLSASLAAAQGPPLPDEKGVVAEAEKKLAADPQNIDLILALGKAQADVWRFQDAIATYTRGIEMAPDNPLLYRHRGHRYVTTRQFDKAVADLEKGDRLDSKSYDILYHLGLAHYLRGDFAKAAAAYRRCREVAPNEDSLAAVSDWLYMTYRRMKREEEAAEVLERIKPDMKIKENSSYFNRLLLYKGLKKESELIGEKATDLEIATLGYGLGNWRLYNGNIDKGREYFERVVKGKYWPAFGFIAAEVELARMGRK